jgi:hypothetical protein
MGQALASACQGLDPDPMWLGPVDAALFLSVVDDLIWFSWTGTLMADTHWLDNTPQPQILRCPR